MDAAAPDPNPRIVTIVGWVWLLGASMRVLAGLLGIWVLEVGGLDRDIPLLGIRSQDVRLRGSVPFLAAQAVDAQMLDHLRANALGGTWAGSERILVAVSELPGAEELVRAVLADHPGEKTISLLAISVSHLEEHWDMQLELPLGLNDEARRPARGESPELRMRSEPMPVRSRWLQLQPSSACGSRRAGVRLRSTWSTCRRCSLPLRSGDWARV